MPSKADTFTVALYSGGNPPYTVIENHQTSGIFVDIFTYIETKSNHEFIFKVMPAARALAAFNQGEIDIEPGVSDEWRVHEKVLGVYSIDYETSAEVIVSNEKMMIDVRTPDDLLGKKVGIVRGYSYPKFDQYLNEGKIKKIENISEINLLKQLDANRLEYIFIGYKTIRYYQKYYPEFKKFTIGNAVQKSLIKMRLHPKKAVFIDELNTILAEMKEDGVIEKIYNKYR